MLSGQVREEEYAHTNEANRKAVEGQILRLCLPSTGRAHTCTSWLNLKAIPPACSCLNL